MAPQIRHCLCFKYTNDEHRTIISIVQLHCSSTLHCPVEKNCAVVRDHQTTQKYYGTNYFLFVQRIKR